MAKSNQGGSNDTGKNKAPTSISLSSTIVDENLDGAQVGFLTGTDPDSKDTLTFTVNDSRFEVVVNAQGQSILQLKPGEALDYEETRSISMQVTATDAGGLTKVQSFTISINDVYEGSERVSVSSTGEQASSDSLRPSISADGRYVAYSSYAPNLVTDDTNASSDIFVFDLQTGTTERVSVNSIGEQGNFDGVAPSISADGRYVTYWSHASNLVAGDTNETSDIFVFDRQTGITERVSVSSTGEQADTGSFYPSISADGRYVAYSSVASNLVADDTNGNPDVFVFDRQTHTTERVSVSSTGEQGNYNSGEASISADGRYVAYTSNAFNLSPDDGDNNDQDIFVHDRQTGITTQVSVSSTGEPGNSDSRDPSISADGRYVTYTSNASRLVAGDTNKTNDIFVHDNQTGVTERVSVSSTGEQGNAGSYEPSISADGRYVTFTSYASNLAPNDTNGYPDVFVFDRQTHTTERVSVSSTGEQGYNTSDQSSISADGSYVAYFSYASNLISGDTNGVGDIFVASTHELLV